jgi:hypothetical protein
MGVLRDQESAAGSISRSKALSSGVEELLQRRHVKLSRKDLADD